MAVEQRDQGRRGGWGLKDTLDELAYLTRSAGARVVGRVSQRADRLTPTYVGKGKLKELVEMLYDRKADVVIFDDELTPPSSATWKKPWPPRSSTAPP